MVAAVAIFAAASCNKELPQENLPAVGETVVYTASTDAADTKAVLNEGTKKSEWVAGDAITIHDGVNGYTYVADKTGPVANFSAKENGFDSYRPVLAVYPAGTYTANVEAKTAKAYIPTWQQAQAGTYHNVAALAVAYSEGNTFAFKNAHALLKFTVNTDNVTHVIFHGNGSEAITGDVNVTLGEDGVESVECLETEFTEQKWNEETQKNEDVKVKKYGTWVECYAYHDDANKYFTKGQTYYIAVAPQEFKGGVTVKVKIDGGEELVAKSTTKPVETKINTILNLGEIKYDAPVVHEWAVAGTFNGWSTTANPMELVDGYYVAKNVTGLNYSDPNKGETGSSTGIKFVNKAAWRGGEGKVTAGTWAYVWGDGGNIYVEDASADKAYDIYLNPNDGDYGKFVIVPAGDPMPEDGVETPEQPEEVTPGEASEWALIGAFSSWADKYFETTNVANFLVCKSVQIKAAEGFLVRKPSTEWKDKYGAGNVNYLKANHYIVTSKDGADMCLEADGTYDIYFDVNAKTIYVMVAGQDYATATEQTANGEEPKQEEPEVTEKVVYLKPNSNWTQSNARFAAYFFGGTTGEKWVSMTKVGDGTYEAHLPEGYDYGCNIIFCRMNPSTTANNWNNKWNQTSDLKTPTDGKNLYTVKAGTWDKGGGTWSVK